MEQKNKPSTLLGKLRPDVFFGTSADLPKIVELDLNTIRQNPDQPRKTFNEEALRELANSIEKHGLIQPITVNSRFAHFNGQLPGLHFDHLVNCRWKSDQS